MTWARAVARAAPSVAFRHTSGHILAQHVRRAASKMSMRRLPARRVTTGALLVYITPAVSSQARARARRNVRPVASRQSPARPAARIATVAASSQLLAKRVANLVMQGATRIMPAPQAARHVTFTAHRGNNTLAAAAAATGTARSACAVPLKRLPVRTVAQTAPLVGTITAWDKRRASTANQANTMMRLGPSAARRAISPAPRENGTAAVAVLLLAAACSAARANSSVLQAPAGAPPALAAHSKM